MKSTFTLLLPLLLCGAALSEEAPKTVTPSHKSIPFQGATHGYHAFRIPAMIRAGNGDLLAFCEGRVTKYSDHGNIDIVLRRSTDEGSTWTPLQIVQEEGGDAIITIGNPVPILDSETGRIHLLFCRNNDRVFHTFSDDHGATWAERREITASVKKPDWKWIATGPGGGIRLSRGKQAGRLVVGCDHASGETKRGWPFGAHVMFSDDHGKTWQIGAVSDGEMNDDGEPVGFHSNENAPLEISPHPETGNSRLYFTFRNQNGQPGRTARGEGWSEDGGETYSSGKIQLNQAIVSPIVHAGITRLRGKHLGDAEDLTVLSAPNHVVEPENDRFAMSLWLSRDEAKTWSKPLLVYPGPSVYSQLIRLKNGDLGLLFENGKTNRYERISFHRIPYPSLSPESD